MVCRIAKKGSSPSNKVVDAERANSSPYDKVYMLLMITLSVIRLKKLPRSGNNTLKHWKILDEYYYYKFIFLTNNLFLSFFCSLSHLLVVWAFRCIFHVQVFCELKDRRIHFFNAAWCRVNLIALNSTLNVPTCSNKMVF